MHLVHFKKINSIHLYPANVEKTKEEEAAEIMCQILYSTKITEPISITYLSDSNDGISEASKGSSQTKGMAVKTSSNQWTIHFPDSTMTAMDTDLMDGNKFYVEQKLMTIGENDDMKKRNKVQNTKDHARQNNLIAKNGFMKKV